MKDYKTDILGFLKVKGAAKTSEIMMHIMSSKTLNVNTTPVEMIIDDDQADALGGLAKTLDELLSNGEIVTYRDSNSYTFWKLKE
jgi:hypothetical protein